MPKYTVLRPIEHNGKLYLPKDAPAPEKAKSAGNGQDLAVDVSGTIELNGLQAQALVNGQISTVSETSGAGTDRKPGKR